MVTPEKKEMGIRIAQIIENKFANPLKKSRKTIHVLARCILLHCMQERGLSKADFIEIFPNLVDRTALYYVDKYWENIHTTNTYQDERFVCTALCQIVNSEFPTDKYLKKNKNEKTFK